MKFKMIINALILFIIMSISNNAWGLAQYRRTTIATMKTISGGLLSDGDLCQIVLSGNLTANYRLDAYSGATADNYFIVSPTTTPGSKRWILLDSSKVRIGLFGNNLATALTAIGTREVTLQWDANVSLAVDANCPETLDIEMVNGGVIALGNYNFTIHGNFIAPIKKVFDCGGTGRVYFGSNSESIVNGDFNSTTTGWGVYQSSLSSVAGGKYGNCLQVTIDSGQTQGAAIQNINVTAREQYFYDLFFKLDTGSYGRLTIKDKTHAYTIIEDLTNILDTTWQHKKGQFTIPVDCSEIQIGLLTYGTAGQIATWDCVSVKKVTRGPSEIYVDWFGGGPDKTASQNNLAFECAIKSCINMGGNIAIGNGTYLISSPILLFDYQTIEGNGSSSIIKLENSTTLTNPLGIIANYYWNDFYSYGIHVKNLVIDGNRQNQTQSQYGIILTRTNGSSVENCEIKNINGYHGIDIVKSDYFIVKGNNVHDFEGDGINASAKSRYGTIIGNIVHTGGYNGGIGIELEGRSGSDWINYHNDAITVSGNTIYNISGHGILSFFSEWSSIIGNTIFIVLGNGIEILGCDFNTISGNSIGDCGITITSATRSAIKVTTESCAYSSQGKSNHCVITGNTCSYASNYGIDIIGDPNYSHNRITVLGNNCTNNIYGSFRADYVTNLIEINNNYADANSMTFGSIVSRSTRGLKTFSSGDTTPSVIGNYDCYQTANATLTKIIDFDDSFIGQKVNVLFGDPNTTIDFTGSSLHGNIGVDWTPVTGDSLSCFTTDNTYWECACNDNTP